MVLDTIQRLQRSSIDHRHMGARYSRLLNVLWRSTPTNESTEPIEGPEAQHNAFSWLDLGAVEYYASRKNIAGWTGMNDDIDDFLSDFNDTPTTTLFTDYRWLNDDNLNMIF